MEENTTTNTEQKTATETNAPMSATVNETAQENNKIDFENPAIKSYIETEIQKGIQKALQGTPPKANTVNSTEQEKAKFEKMTYKERLNLFKSNPQKYYELAKGKI